MDKDIETRQIGRREFLRGGLLAGITLALGPSVLKAGEPTLSAAAGGAAKTDVWLVHGENHEALMGRVMRLIAENGGLGAETGKVAVKVNSSFNSPPEKGHNVNPAVLEGFFRGCRKDYKIDSLLAADLPLDTGPGARRCFVASGLADAAKRGGGTMLNLAEGFDRRTSSGKYFRMVDIAGGKVLRKSPVASCFLDADVVVNMPIAKHHGAAKLSMAMKNWMGAVADRRSWHKGSESSGGVTELRLHHCICDFCSFMKPRWTVIDATRTMMDSGPGGNAWEVRKPDCVVLSKDQVAADAVAATTFFGYSDPAEIPYLAIARERGLGETRLARINLHRIEA